MLPEEPLGVEENVRALNWVRGWILLGVMTVLWGCATSKDVRILDNDMLRFQSQLTSLQKEGDAFKKDLSTFQNNQRGIEKDVSILRADLNGEIKRVEANFALRTESLQSNMKTLSTSIEENKEYLKKPEQEIDRVKLDVAVRTRTLEERGKALEEKNRILEERGRAFEEKNRVLEDRTRFLEERLKEAGNRFKGLEEKMNEIVLKLREVEKTSSSKEDPVEIKGPTTGAGAGDLYKDAYETLQRGNLEEASRKFEAFLRQHPNTELSDNAQFWIGETYYRKKDFEKAILEYEKAIIKYPEGDKIPAALFKQAFSFMELGDKTNARNLFKRVVERYPHSEQAEMAKKQLEGIK